MAPTIFIKGNGRSVINDNDFVVEIFGLLLVGPRQRLEGSRYFSCHVVSDYDDR